MVGQKIGGVNVFAGGLACYEKDGTLCGALGVSGASSGDDHNICWKLRCLLGLDRLPGGIGPTKTDNIIYDIENGKSKGGWGHPECSKECTNTAKKLTRTYATS